MMEHRSLLLTRTLLFMLACTASACATYQSTYVPPPDGRARPVWRATDRDVVVDLGGARPSQFCLDQLHAWSATGDLRLVQGDVPRPAVLPDRVLVSSTVDFWIPVASVSGPGPGPAPGPAPGTVRVHGAPIQPGAPTHITRIAQPAGTLPPRAATRIAGPSRTSSGSSSSNSGNDGGKILGVIAIAVIALAIIDIGIALSDPEGVRSYEAIDQVNVFNDLMRSPGSPCTYEAGQ